MAEKTKNEKKQRLDVEVVFILDRSGSMSGLEADTIGGFNSTLNRQKKEEGGVTWTTVLFDDMYEIIHDRLPIEKVGELSSREYYVRGMTALLDAVGRTIDRITAIRREQAKKPDRTLFVITTDGMENASREYSYGRVKELIEKQTEECGWEFLFLGANMDAVGVASRMGIKADRAATFLNDSAGIQNNYEVLDREMYCLRSEGGLDVKALEKIREDYRNRS